MMLTVVLLHATQGGGAAPARQPDPADEGYGALGGPGAQHQESALRDLIKKAAPEGLPMILTYAACFLHTFLGPQSCVSSVTLHCAPPASLHH